MKTFNPVTSGTHASKAWRRAADYTFAASEAMVPVAGLELPAAGAHLPLAFVKRDGLVQLVAMLGVESGVNLLVGSDGKWLGAYVPAELRAYPFRLARIEGRSDMALCVAEESEDSEGEAFYDGSGTLAAPVRQIMEFLGKIETNRQQTMFAAAALDEAGVLAPWPIKIRSRDGVESAVQGILRVDERALNALDDAAFAKLRKVGALPIAYVQMVSMARLDLLQRLAKEKAEAVAAAEPAAPNLDSLRLEDGNLRFD